VAMPHRLGHRAPPVPPNLPGLGLGAGRFMIP
jgi:hypothetical protein